MYINLPGSYVQLQDGNLTSFTRDTTPSVLVLGTASRGLTSEPYLATDLLAVVNEFGATSEVTRAVSEARKGGATNIVIYRLPGIAPYVSAIGADISGGTKLGFKVTPLQASPEAAAKYALAYRHSKNIGDAGTSADGIEVVGELMVINLDTNELVWKGSAATGAITDLGEVDVQFEMDDIADATGSGTEAEKIAIAVSAGSRVYTGLVLTAVSATGSGATASVTLPTLSGTGSYAGSQLTLVGAGSGYTVGDTLKVLGTALSGADTTNDFNGLSVATLVSRVISGVAVAGGTGGTVNVTVNADGSYSAAINAAGSGYSAGTVTIDGSDLGGIDTTNDLEFTIGVGGAGAITTITGESGLAVGAIATLTKSPNKQYVAQGFTSISYSVAVSGVVAAGTYAVSQPYTTAAHVASALAGALNADAEFLKLPFTAYDDGAAVAIVADGVANADGDLVYGAAHSWAGYTARPFFTALPTVSGPTGQGTVTTSFDTPYAYGGAADVGLYPADDARPFAPAVGGVFVPLSRILDGGAASSFGINRQAFNYVGLTAIATSLDETTDAEYYVGDAQESISLMKRYEKLHTSFEDLDLAAFDYIYPCSVALDSKNVTDADVLTETVTVTFAADTYPTPKGASDYLGYCHIKNNGDYTYSYLWSDDGANLKVASDGAIAGHAGETLSFKEVNFAHLLANYCYENSTDYKFVHGIIGTRIPDGVNPRSIRLYYGSAPSYSLNQEDGSSYVASSEADGMGLLGHRFVGGRSDFNGGLKHGGFFATVDNSLDYETQGNLLTDENGKKIDLGKYISVVSAFGRLIDDINVRRPTYITNAAAVVAGMLPRTPVADSLINRQIPGLAIDYRVESKMVDVACGLGLVVAKNEGGAPLIADSPTFASPTSDYVRLTSMRIVAKVAQELRAAARPYIGKGLSAPKRAALESAIGEVFKYNMNGETQQTITSGTFKIEQSASDRVLGKMRVKVTLTPVFELRQITFSVNLSAQ
jgi:hypothetical protein